MEVKLDSHPKTVVRHCKGVGEIESAKLGLHVLDDSLWFDPLMLVYGCWKASCQSQGILLRRLGVTDTSMSGQDDME